jgi:hypothetical protein
VADVEDDHRVVPDREDDAALVVAFAVEHLPDLFREFVVLRRDRAEQGPSPECLEGLLEPAQPPIGDGLRGLVA